MSTENQQYGPSFRACKLYRRKSQKGTTYFAGRWGGLRATVVKSKEVAEDGTPIWNLLASEAPPKQDGNQQRRPASSNGQRDWQRPFDNEGAA